MLGILAELMGYLWIATTLPQMKKMWDKRHKPLDQVSPWWLGLTALACTISIIVFWNIGLFSATICNVINLIIDIVMIGLLWKSRITA